jgi:hypothetical protein
LKGITAAIIIMIISTLVISGIGLYNYHIRVEGAYKVTFTTQNFTISDINGETTIIDTNTTGHALVHFGWIVTVKTVKGLGPAPKWKDITVKLRTRSGETYASMKGVGRDEPYHLGYDGCCASYHYAKDSNHYGAGGVDLNGTDTESIGREDRNAAPNPGQVTFRSFVVVDNDGNDIVGPGDYILLNRNPSESSPPRFIDGYHLELEHRSSVCGAVLLS